MQLVCIVLQDSGVVAHVAEIATLPVPDCLSRIVTPTAQVLDSPARSLMLDNEVFTTAEETDKLH